MIVLLSSYPAPNGRGLRFVLDGLRINGTGLSSVGTSLDAFSTTPSDAVGASFWVPDRGDVIGATLLPQPSQEVNPGASPRPQWEQTFEVGGCKSVARAACLPLRTVSAHTLRVAMGDLFCCPGLVDLWRVPVLGELIGLIGHSGMTGTDRSRRESPRLTSSKPFSIRATLRLVGDLLSASGKAGGDSLISGWSKADAAVAAPLHACVPVEYVSGEYLERFSWWRLVRDAVSRDPIDVVENLRPRDVRFIDLYCSSNWSLICLSFSFLASYSASRIKCLFIPVCFNPPSGGAALSSKASGLWPR